MTPEALAQAVRAAVMHVLVEALGLADTPRPVVDALGEYLGCAELADRVARRLGLPPATRDE